jgi:uncharacterized membrane protein HdeD (DUF308 family)
VNSVKFTAAVTILLGVAAIITPYLFGKIAVMLLGGIMMASGVVALLYINSVRKEGIALGVIAP